MKYLGCLGRKIKYYRVSKCVLLGVGEIRLCSFKSEEDVIYEAKVEAYTDEKYLDRPSHFYGVDILQERERERELVRLKLADWLRLRLRLN